MRARAMRLRAAIAKLEAGSFFRLTPGGREILGALEELAGWIAEAEERMAECESIRDVISEGERRLAAEREKLLRVIDVAQQLGQLEAPIVDRPGGPKPGDIPL